MLHCISVYILEFCKGINPSISAVNDFLKSILLRSSSIVETALVKEMEEECEVVCHRQGNHNE